MQLQLTNFLAVGIGGTIGAILRYGIGLVIEATHFPLSTLVVNLIGSICLGFLVSWHEQRPLSNSVILFLGVGVMGSLTTMSTFAVETINSGSITISTINIIVTLIGVLFGALFGKLLAISI